MNIRKKLLDSEIFVREVIVESLDEVVILHRFRRHTLNENVRKNTRYKKK